MFVFEVKQFSGGPSSIVNTHCSCRGVEFGIQHTYVTLQPSLTPVPEDLFPSHDLCAHQASKQYI